MARVLLLTNSMGASAEVIPALALLSHQVRVLPAEASALIDAPDYEVIFVDARRDLPGAKSLMRVINSTGISAPLILITTEGGLSAINAEWGASDVILDTAGPAEIDARIRIVIGRKTAEFADAESEIRSGEVVIDESAYTAKIKGRTLRSEEHTSELQSH